MSAVNSRSAKPIELTSAIFSGGASLYGKRKNGSGSAPPARRIARSARSTSAAASPGPSRSKCGWLYEWFPSPNPCAARARTAPGCRSANSPVGKNAAGTPSRRSTPTTSPIPASSHAALNVSATTGRSAGRSLTSLPKRSETGEGAAAREGRGARANARSNVMSSALKETEEDPVSGLMPRQRRGGGRRHVRPRGGTA